MPWGEIVHRIYDFLDPKYLPDGFEFSTPDHMKVKACVTLLKHLQEREKSLGVGPDVFAWKAFVRRLKGGVVVPEPAVTSVDLQNEDFGPVPRRPRGRPAGKGPRRHPPPAPIDGGADSGMSTPDDVDWRLAGADAGHKSLPESGSEDESDPGHLIVQQRKFDWMQSGSMLIRMPTEPGSDDADSDNEHTEQPAAPKRKRVLSSDEDEDLPQGPRPRPRPVARPASLAATLAAAHPDADAAAPPAAPSPPTLGTPADPPADPPAGSFQRPPVYSTGAAAPPAALSAPAVASAFPRPPASFRSAAANPPTNPFQRPAITSALAAGGSNTAGAKKGLADRRQEEVTSPAPPEKRTRQDSEPAPLPRARRERKDSQRVKDIQAAAGPPKAPPKRKTAGGSTKKAAGANAVVPKTKAAKRKT